MNKYECSFCGNVIDQKESKVTALLVITNWEMNDEEQQSQQLFCHLKCLKKAMNEADYLYIEE